jgi:WD40 repeat protein
VAPDTGQTRVEFQGLTASITAAAVVKNGRLATAEESGVIRIWDPQTGQQLRAFNHGLPPEVQGAVYKLHWAADGRRLLAAGQHMIALWDTETPTRTWAYLTAAAKSHVAFSPQEDQVAIADERDFVVLRATDAAVMWRNTDAHAQPIHGIQWISGRQWPNQDRYGAFLGNVIRWSNGEAWRGDNTRLLLLTWSGDGTARLWDWEHGTEIMRLPDSAPLDFAALSEDGLHLLTAGDSGVVRVWQVWLQHPEGMVESAQAYRTRPLTEQQQKAFNLTD